jgi:hypothetical protein
MAVSRCVTSHGLSGKKNSQELKVDIFALGLNPYANNHARSRASSKPSSMQ